MENKKYKIGYTQGTYDLFHMGHLNLIKHAKEQCDYLIVGINSDNLVKQYKNKKANIPENDRAKIVEALKYVNKVIIVDTLDKKNILNLIHFDVNTEEELGKVGVPVVYLPHTNGISTSRIIQKIKDEN